MDSQKKKKKNLSCPMLVNRHVCPSCCLYSIIFSSLPVGILYIYCSNTRSHTRTDSLNRKNEGKHNLQQSSFFIDLSTCLCNLRSSCQHSIYEEEK